MKNKANKKMLLINYLQDFLKVSWLEIYLNGVSSKHPVREGIDYDSEHYKSEPSKKLKVVFSNVIT